MYSSSASGPPPAARLSDVIDEDFCSRALDDDVTDTSVFDDGRPNAGRDDDDDGCRLP